MPYLWFDIDEAKFPPRYCRLLYPHASLVDRLRRKVLKITRQFTTEFLG